jgi:hypothetical protein
MGGLSEPSGEKEVHAIRPIRLGLRWKRCHGREISLGREELAGVGRQPRSDGLATELRVPGAEVLDDLLVFFRLG